jgi:nucleoid DNA-binding protein
MKQVTRKKEFIAAMATEMNSTKKAAETAYNAFRKTVIDAIKADNDISLSEFFTAKTVLQKEGSVNVGGIPRKYPEKFHVKMKMSKKVSDRINETLKAKTKKGGKK